jgi:hypothetical protein
MACKIAENQPLSLLRRQLGTPNQCHSLREECIHGYERHSGERIMGIPGAALGYCQGVFKRAGGAETHTQHVTRLLSEIGAPWAKSHELFWGNRRDESPSEFVEQGMRPLWGSGRVPILITELDPARNIETIESIVATTPAIYPGEVVLIRLVLSGKESVDRASALIRRVFYESRMAKEMPKWWPLLQSDMKLEEWKRLEEVLGDDWRFVNVAVNPFMPSDVYEYLRDQITVGQVPVGLAEGVSSEGTIKLAPGMVRLTGAVDCAAYSLPEYMEQLSTLDTAPTLIVLGPSLLGWSDVINQRRIAALLPPLRDGCNILWGSLEASQRDMIWNLAA